MSTATKANSQGTVAKPLAAKLVEAALDVENVEKRGRNDFHKYDYARAEDVAAAATKALLARGVLADFEPVRVDLEPTADNKGLIATVEGQLVVTDSATGEQLRRKAMGSGSDRPGDKAIYKAMTGARKYAFIHLLGIPIGDDPDAHRGEGRGPARQPKLERKRVDAILARFKSAEMKYGEIGVALGAAGIDGLRANSAKAVRERISGLTDEQAAALEAVLDG